VIILVRDPPVRSIEHRDDARYDTDSAAEWSLCIRQTYL